MVTGKSWSTRVLGALSAGALVLFGVAATRGWLDGLRIDTPMEVAPVALGAAVLVAAVMARRSRRWWTRTLPASVACVVVVEWLAAWYLRASAIIVDHYPPSFLIWVGLALLTPTVVVGGWSAAGSRRRLAGVAAVPLAVAAAFLLINSHYGYWPTLGDLLDHPLPGQVSAATFRREVAAVLPSSGSHGRAAPPDEVADAAGARHGRAPAWALRRAAPVLSASAMRSATATAAAAAAATSNATSTSRPSLAVPTATATGQFAAVDIPATASHFVHRWDYVYLPPAYFTPARSQLGVLILLAGTPSSPAIWASAGGALDTANAYARAHDGRAPVLLFVDANGSWSGDTECVDSSRGHAETYLTRDVVSFAIHRLGLRADPARWGIVGFSEGGTCAYDLALRHPGLFHYVVDLAGDAAPNVVGSTLHELYAGSRPAMNEHQPSWLLAHPVGSYRPLTAWFGAGVEDTSHLRLARLQTSAARRAGLHASWFVGPDGHDWQFCTWALRRLLPELATEVSPPAPHSTRVAHPAGTSAPDASLSRKG